LDINKKKYKLVNKASLKLFINFTQIISNFMKSIIIFILSLNFLVANSQQIAPNFTVTDTDGKKHELYDILENGQRIVLDFFYVGCSYCQLYSPYIQESYKNFGCNNGEVFFLGINWNDTDNEVMAFDSTYGIEYPSASGIQGGADSVISLYNISFFTTLMVIDTNKNILKVISPPNTANIDSFLLAIGAQKMPCNTFVKDINSDNIIKLNQNPINDNIISLNIDNQDVYSLKLYDSNGKLIYEKTKFLNAGTNNVSISNDVDAGFYILIISANNSRSLLKLIKQ